MVAAALAAVALLKHYHLCDQQWAMILPWPSHPHVPSQLQLLLAPLLQRVAVCIVCNNTLAMCVQWAPVFPCEVVSNMV
jgi:hypothetical protein